VIPFFPFSEPEAAVVAHESLLIPSDSLRRPMDVKNGNFRNHIYLDIMEDRPLCKQIARDSYLRNSDSRKEDACCIQREVDAKAENQLTRKWQDILGEAKNTMNAGPNMLFRA
jgi:hypothetical protein